MPRNKPYILMVVPNLPEQGGGGVVQVIGYLRDAWGEMDDAPAMRLLVSRGRGSIWLAPFYLLRALAIVAVESGRGRVALVHVNVASKGSTWRKLTIVAAAALFGVPIVLHLHGGGYRLFVAGLPDFAVRLVGWMFRRASRVIVLGQDWGDFVSATFHVKTENIVILPNGVPDPGPGPRRSEIVGEAARLLFMGRFSPEKGISDLVAALSNDELADLDWTAMIAGGGDASLPGQDPLKAKLSARITYPGWLSPDEARQAYLDADIFVLPSHLEGLSIALLEAMAHGIAVVATPVGAHGDVIRDGENGLLVPPGDIPALRGALHRVISDQALRRNLGRAARDSFIAQYHIARTAEQLCAVYDDVLA
jgi:glycosyltransferase involved in cell wall biosynthesis